MYEGAVTTVKTFVGDTKELSITVGLHQGSTLSPYLFTLAMHELINTIQHDVWYLLIDEANECVNQNIELSWRTLESRSFRINRSKLNTCTASLVSTRRAKLRCVAFSWWWHVLHLDEKHGQWGYIFSQFIWDWGVIVVDAILNQFQLRTIK